MHAPLLFALVLSAVGGLAAGPLRFRLSLPFPLSGTAARQSAPPTRPGQPSTANCSKRFFEQPLNHFGFDASPPPFPSTFQQRYFVCRESSWLPGKPIFFYTGNEANVELFVNMTGLMWENAAAFGAMLVFAEHRYFGESLPFPQSPMPPPPQLRFLTTDQALADYAVLIRHIKNDKKSNASAVIGFGGSYGGMLCAWLRLKYPSALDGCIAGSAPVAAFLGMTPAFDIGSFSRIVTEDATTAGGSAAACASNVNASWPTLQRLMETAEGRRNVSHLLRLCDVPEASMLSVIQNYIVNAWGFMAMSSYPYASSYLLLGGGGTLPPYPLRVACNYLSTPFAPGDEDSLLEAVRQAIGVYYNNTGRLSCLNVSGEVNEATAVVDYLWGYLACTTMVIPSSQNGIDDMFPPQPWSTADYEAMCRSTYAVDRVSPLWVDVSYGGRDVQRTATNIVFSNGGLDPWRGGGILNATGPSVFSVIIPNVGHHMDLMFANANDTAAVREARQFELKSIAQWILHKSP